MESHNSHRAGIVLAAAGSTSPHAHRAYCQIDNLVRQRFPDYAIVWTFTSERVRTPTVSGQKAAKGADNALKQLAALGVERTAVQSLHVIPGGEYNKLVTAVETCRAGQVREFSHVSIGAPLLQSDDDIRRVADALMETAPEEPSSRTGLIFVGHGTPHPGGAAYARLSAALKKRNRRAFLGMIESRPAAADVAAECRVAGIDQAWLIPLMAVAGHHVRKDLAGAHEDSWQSVMSSNGIAAEVVMEGLLENGRVVDLWMEHLERALS